MPTGEALARETVWEAGRLDARRGPKAVLFGRTYEDPSIEREVFPAGGRVMCIASAGCTPRALCEQNQVVAVDINPVQVAYARGRLAGEPPIRGKAETVMGALRPLLPLVGIRRAALEAFLDLSDPAAQAARWRSLCTGRFRLGLDLLFSFTALRVVYASPLLSLLPPRFGRVLLSRFERGFSTHPNRDNPYARALFLGEPPTETGPARGPVELVCSDAASYLEAQPQKSFDGISLSNILDGASPGYRARLLTAVRHATKDDGTVVLRSFAEPTDPAHAALAGRDRSLLWGSLQVGRATELR